MVPQDAEGEGMNRVDSQGRIIEDDDYDYSYSSEGYRMAYRKHDATGVQAEDSTWGAFLFLLLVIGGICGAIWFIFF